MVVKLVLSDLAIWNGVAVLTTERATMTMVAELKNMMLGDSRLVDNAVKVAVGDCSKTAAVRVMRVLP